MNNKKHFQDFRKRKKERIVYVMGDKCSCCGYDKCISALELHHLNPEEKEFNLSGNWGKGWDITVSEIKKTILVCANCHREIHSGIIDNNSLTSSFIQERADEITQLNNDIKTHKYYFCKNCGEIVSYKNEYCPTCAAEMRRKVERPSRIELKNMIREMPFTSIAKKYQVSDNAIRKWCKSYNLPSKKSDIKLMTDEEWDLI